MYDTNVAIKRMFVNMIRRDLGRVTPHGQLILGNPNRNVNDHYVTNVY
jgi:hypothetical protein